MKRIPILIDTDPGVDDFFCLAFGGAFPEILDLRAVTTVGGNNYTSVTTQNALDILSFLKINAPVCSGATSYLKAEFDEPVAEFHGHNGLADLVLPRSPNKAVDIPVWDMIYKVACECEGELVIVTVGPETNLALTIQKHPDIVGKVKRIVAMGGSTTFGNITPYAEANIGHDPFAAKIVFESGIPVDMVGLNVTHMCLSYVKQFDAYRKNAREDVIQFMRGLIAFRDGQPMHDAIAIATLLDPDFIQWQNCNIHVETEDCEHFGQTVPTEGNLHRVAVDCDRSRYDRIFEDMINRYR